MSPKYKSQVRAERQGEFGQRENIGDRTPLQGMVTAEPLTGVAPSVVPAAPATPAANPASTPSDQAASGSTESSTVQKQPRCVGIFGYLFGHTFHTRAFMAAFQYATDFCTRCGFRP